MSRTRVRIKKPEELPPRTGYMSAYDAAVLRDTKCVSQLKVMHDLILMCQKKISYSATLGLNDTIWTIPKYGIEKPWYDIKKIAITLIYHFRRQQYYVKQIEPGVLYLSWRWSSSSKVDTE
jgi:hypothetical protein